MAGFSDYTEGLVMGWMNGEAMPAPPAALYVALFNGDPTDAGSGGAEVTTTLRPAGRVVGTFTRTGGRLTSSAEVNFGAASGGAPISHFAVYGVGSGGQMLQAGPLSGGAQTIGAGTVVKFPAGALILELD